jgi:hypothetical protein
VCNHEVNSKKTTIMIDKTKLLGILQNPRIYRGVCKECGKEFKFIKQDGKFKEISEGG